MGIWLGPMGKPKDKLPPKFVTAGVEGTDYLYATETDPDGTVHFEIVVLNPCAFTFQRVQNVDVCLVGSGESGESGVDEDTEYIPDVIGGSGGSGGKILRVANIQLTTGLQYLLNPGVNGADTTGFGYSSANGTDGQGAGGKGARIWGPSYISYDADPGSSGEYAFGSSYSLIFPGRKYAAGGGGGGCWNTPNNRGNSNASGGESGGGDGGTFNSRNGTNGDPGTGSGGGGGYAYYEGTNGTGGSGGSGAIIIRDAR